MEFVAATNNPKKLAELARMLEKAGHTVVSMDQAGLKLTVVEDGDSFTHNALKKAKAVCAATGKPAVADDSGLEVEALGGAPGVYSARFAGEPTSDEANNEKLLRLLQYVPCAERRARFVSVVALAMPGGGTLTAKGTVDGRIGTAKSGANGFGYDPLFYVNNRSFAEMTDEEKDAISHRAVAMRSFFEQLPAFLGSQNRADPVEDNK